MTIGRPEKPKEIKIFVITVKSSAVNTTSEDLKSQSNSNQEGTLEKYTLYLHIF